MLKQSAINYKSLLQTNGPSPVRREHLNALKVEARMGVLVLLRKHNKKDMGEGRLRFPVWEHERLTTSHRHRAETRHCCSSRAASTSQSSPSPPNLSITPPTLEEADRWEHHSEQLATLYPAGKTQDLPQRSAESRVWHRPLLTVKTPLSGEGLHAPPPPLWSPTSIVTETHKLHCSSALCMCRVKACTL